MQLAAFPRTKRLTLSLQFPYFKSAPAGWKVRLQSVQGVTFVLRMSHTELSPPQPLAQSLFRQSSSTSDGPWQGQLLDN